MEPADEAAQLDAALNAALNKRHPAMPFSCSLGGGDIRDGREDTGGTEIEVDAEAELLEESLLIQPGVPTATSTADRSDNIRVFVRARPPNVREGCAPSRDVVRIDTAASAVHLYAEPPRSFAFDGVLPESSTQEEVFALVGTAVGEACLSGYNGSIYVYGQTGSGKTHTMQGHVGSVHSMHTDERRGLMCRIIELVFNEVARRHREDGNVQYKCKCSYLEIYKEQITDLLEVGPNSTNLQVREDINRGVYVERLSEQSVWTLADAIHILWKGFHQRHVGATQLNELSSRSHAVFTLVMEATSTTPGGVTSTKVARLNLIDLAGSERQSFDPHNPSQMHESLRVKEAGAINRSLSALTNVIMSLSHAGQRRRLSMGVGGAVRRPFVRYRDSKLTFLLRDSLGGNSKTVIVACVSPSALCFGETLSTLKFAARAKHIRCAAVMNEEHSGTVESLMLEVKSLKQQLELLSSRGLIPGALNAMSTVSLVEEPRSQRVSVVGMDGAGEDDDLEAILGQDDEELRRLSGRRRVRRLEILLAAALERERRCELKRHKLDKFTQYFNGLLERKAQFFDALRDYFAFLVDHAVSDALFLPEITARLTLFRHQLSTVSSDSRELADAIFDRGSDSVDVPEQQLPMSASLGDLGCRPDINRPVTPSDGGSPRSQSFGFLMGGDMARRGMRRGTTQSLQLRSPSQRLLHGSVLAEGSTLSPAASAALLSSPTGGCFGEQSVLIDEELTLLRAENRLLRRQLESHPELYRLAIENRLLREHLASLVQQHALARDEPPWPKGHKHRRRAMDGHGGGGRTGAGAGAGKAGAQGLVREPSLTRTSRSALLGLGAESDDLPRASSVPSHGRKKDATLALRLGIEDVTQISPSSSSAGSDLDDNGGRGGSNFKMTGNADAAAFLPMLAREVEELLRTKDSLETSLKSIARSTLRGGESRSDGVSKVNGGVGGGATLRGSAHVDAELKVSNEILRSASEALRFSEGILAKGRGEPMMLSAAIHEVQDAASARIERGAEGLDERDVFLSLMRSLPSEVPTLSRHGCASSAPHLTLSRGMSSSDNLTQSVGTSELGLSTPLRSSNSTGSAVTRLLRNRSTMQLHRISEQPNSPRSSVASPVNCRTPRRSLTASMPSSAAVAAELNSPGNMKNAGDVVKDASGKLRSLTNQLELVSDAYRDMRDQLKPLQDEYFKTLDQAKFLEAQCCRLDVHCRLLEERAKTMKMSFPARPQVALAAGRCPRMQPFMQNVSASARLPGGNARWQLMPNSPQAQGTCSSVESRSNLLFPSGIDSPEVVMPAGGGNRFGADTTHSASSNLLTTAPSALLSSTAGSGNMRFEAVRPCGLGPGSSVGHSLVGPSNVKQSNVGTTIGAEQVRRASSTTALSGQSTMSGSSSALSPGPEVPPRGLLYAASLQELRYADSASASPGVVPQAMVGAGAPAPWQGKAFLRRVVSAPQLSMVHGSGALRTVARADKPMAGYGVQGQVMGGNLGVRPNALQPRHSGGFGDGSTDSVFSSTTFLSLARQPGTKTAALQYLMTSTGTGSLGTIGEGPQTETAASIVGTQGDMGVVRNVVGNIANASTSAYPPRQGAKQVEGRDGTFVQQQLPKPPLHPQLQTQAVLAAHPHEVGRLQTDRQRAGGATGERMIQQQAHSSHQAFVSSARPPVSNVGSVSVGSGTSAFSARSTSARKQHVASSPARRTSSNVGGDSLVSGGSGSGPVPYNAVVAGGGAGGSASNWTASGFSAGNCGGSSSTGPVVQRPEGSAFTPVRRQVSGSRVVGSQRPS